jgi:hypothetical protein
MNTDGGAVSARLAPRRRTALHGSAATDIAALLQPKDAMRPVGRLQHAHLGLSKPDTQRGNSILEVPRPGHTHDGGDNTGLGSDPGQRDLRQIDASNLPVTTSLAPVSYMSAVS